MPCRPSGHLKQKPSTNLNHHRLPLTCQVLLNATPRHFARRPRHPFVFANTHLSRVGFQGSLNISRQWAVRCHWLLIRTSSKMNQRSTGDRSFVDVLAGTYARCNMAEVRCRILDRDHLLRLWIVRLVRLERRSRDRRIVLSLLIRATRFFKQIRARTCAVLSRRRLPSFPRFLMTMMEGWNRHCSSWKASGATITTSGMVLPRRFLNMVTVDIAAMCLSCSCSRGTVQRMLIEDDRLLLATHTLGDDYYRCGLTRTLSQTRKSRLVPYHYWSVA